MSSSPVRGRHAPFPSTDTNTRGRAAAPSGRNERRSGGRRAEDKVAAFDVTARDQAEERFRLVVEAASNGMVMLDASLRITLVNARVEAIFGYSRDLLLGLTVDMLLPDDDIRALFSRAKGVHEVLGRRKDGVEVPLEMTIDPIKGSEAVLLSLVDIGERRHADARLKQERIFLRQVIDIDPSLIFAKDREGRFTLANKAVADVYGTTAEALMGKTDSDYNPNSDEVAAFRRDDLEVMDTKRERFIAEEHVTDSKGRSRFLQTVKRPIIGEDGIANQVLGVSTDITSRKQAELDLVRQRDELARMSRFMMLAELSASIAHELNQPLTAILSNAQAALRFMDQGEVVEVREILQDIVNDDRRAGQVIQGMRQLLLKGETRRERVDLNGVVQDALRLMRSDCLTAGITPVVQLAPGLPATVGDRVQVQQVVINLIVNACDAMSAGMPAADRKLVISTMRDGEFLRVCVADSGPGVAPQDIDKMFDLFYTTKSHGLGMGLSICRNLVEAHGGQLRVVNNEGRGATFCFTLPAILPESA